MRSSLIAAIAYILGSLSRWAPTARSSLMWASLVAEITDVIVNLSDADRAG
jgi:hypothetical protein